MPVLLDIGSVSPGQLLVFQISGWTAMSFLDMSMVLGRFLVLSRQICAMFFGKTGVGSASCPWWGPSLLLFNQHVKAVDNLVRFIVAQVVFGHLSSP